MPCSKIDLVQKYVGGKKLKPPLAKIGGKAWQRQKKAAEQAVNDLASDMLEVQARRDARPGIRFPDDTEWQHAAVEQGRHVLDLALAATSS